MMAIVKKLTGEDAEKVGKKDAKDSEEALFGGDRVETEVRTVRTFVHRPRIEFETLRAKWLNAVG